MLLRAVKHMRLVFHAFAKSSIAVGDEEVIGNASQIGPELGMAEGKLLTSFPSAIPVVACLTCNRPCMPDMRDMNGDGVGQSTVQSMTD